MIEEVTLLVTLLRQLPWIATRQVLEDNVCWQACLIASLSVIINTTRDRPAYDNARLTYKAWGNGHYQWGLMSNKKTIPAHEEVLWNYGASYIYPTFD